MSKNKTIENIRLEEEAAHQKNWKRFGPYLSERQWSTVREDYSEDGSCWDYFPHDDARSRAYRWGEDGLLGFCDRQCRLCFSVALWNEKDPILKERLFGLTGPEGNHGEDVKELYYYLDATPTYSYAKALYKYPQAAFPYDHLVQENGSRDKSKSEYELIDTGVFDDNRYFDVFAEYAKNSPNDLLIRLTVVNHGPKKAKLHVLPTLWFRNTWQWGCDHEGCTLKPMLKATGQNRILTDHETMGQFVFHTDVAPDGNSPKLLFTENQTNHQKLYNKPNDSPYVKDAFHEHVIHSRGDVINKKGTGTKAAAWYELELESGEQRQIQLRLCHQDESPTKPFGQSFDRVFDQRIKEADDFYKPIIRYKKKTEQYKISRQAYAGLLWTNQFYHYVVDNWLNGDPNTPAPPAQRKKGRNHDWPHLYNHDVISMPDKWEYPWYAAWDLAFHMIPMAKVDPDFAKKQLLLFLREWYMHPNGQLPAYEFCLGDVNPPVHAWACWKVYVMSGKTDTRFLASTFQKLLLNFTWWVNRKDANGNHLFSGGFLGLDNIGVFDRSRPLPKEITLEQADGTAWMAFYSVTMLRMALELAKTNPEYEDMASKFFEHFIHIADAINNFDGSGLWSETSGFYYDTYRVTQPDGSIKKRRVRLRSLVGLVPLIAVEVFNPEVINQFKDFQKRSRWFMENKKDLAAHLLNINTIDGKRAERHLIAIPTQHKLTLMLRYLLDETEFLSDYGIRSMSKVHEDEPYIFKFGQEHITAQYTPGESDTVMFGGNSNWRGPIWFPLNYLIIEALRKYHRFYGDQFHVECPFGSGNMMNLLEVSHEIERRLARLFLPDKNNHRPCHGDATIYKDNPTFKDLILFHEYFHGDHGKGLGASHQTGWTALIANCLDEIV